MVSIAEEEIAAVMNEMAYGLYIVGSHSATDEANGMMADWVMQVAFKPRLIAISFENDAHTLANIRETRAFTVNLLGRDPQGMHLAKHFAQPYFDAKIAGRVRSPSTRVHRKLDGIDFFRSTTGCPILQNAIAWAECEAMEFLPVGDHTLVVGRVLAGRVLRDEEPLTSEYSGWPYSG